MICQNCNEKEANVKYTQIVNGVKKQVNLCEQCAHELGIDSISFPMPIHFSNFFADMLEEGAEDFLPSIMKRNPVSCHQCGMRYEEFVEKGRFGCDGCYDSFETKLDTLLKKIHGANRHIGRIAKTFGSGEQQGENQRESKNTKKGAGEEEILEVLKDRLKQEIKEERYEDAAKTRDEIKKIEGGN